ncbi:MAG: Gfo/Idh/MocA family oxidoreductase [Gammaproteobacteria bacterium]
MNRIKTAVIGVGYLGKFHAEKYSLLPEAELVAVCDTDQQRANEIATRLGVRSYTDYQQLAGQVEAVTIAVPTLLHYEVAKFFLSQGIHVLLEKPIATTVPEAEELVKLAKKRQLILQIGHLERFNTVMRALYKILEQPVFIESYRLAPFRPRGTDVNVVLDLMIHDIDIIQDIVGASIINIVANGAPVLSPEIDIANARLQFANGCVANVTASRISVDVIRKLRIFQHDAYITVNLHNKKLTVRRKGHNEMFPGIPEIVSEEQAFGQGDALRDEVAAFLEAIRNGTPPLVSGEAGTQALATALRITDIVTKQSAHFANAAATYEK